MFITLEGGEGVGKSTLALNLKKYFENLGKEVILTREPGGTKLAEQIRNMILNNKMDNITEMFLFSAARNDHLKNVILPALNENKIVICDRFIDSSKVYQGLLNENNIYDEIEKLNQLILSEELIDFTFLLDMDPTLAIDRIKLNNRKTNRYDEIDIKQHKKIRNGFLSIANNNKRIKIINANQSQKNILKDCISFL